MQGKEIVRTDLGAGEGKEIRGGNFSNRWLSDVNGKEVLYENCVFSASIIERGYFFHSKFRNCKFIGTRFIDCNFRQATFDQCIFDYSDFNRCILPIPQILANLPSHANVRWEFLHNLRANARAIGDVRHEAAIVSKEIDAEIEHWRLVRQCPSGYYAKYNNFRDKSVARYQSSRLFVERYVWGHGESLTRLFIAAIVALVVSAVFHCTGSVGVLGSQTLSSMAVSFSKSLLFVFQLFIDLPSVAGSDVTESPYISSVVVIIRYLTIGLAIPVLYKQIAKR